MISNINAGEIILDEITGSSGDTAIIAGETIRFTFRVINNYPWDIFGFTNGFRVYSPDGATWQPLVADTLPLNWALMFDQGVYINFHSNTGNGADTVSFGGNRIYYSGFQSGFNQNVWWIETMVFPGDIGKHFCIDSSFFYPVGTWMWVNDEGTTIYPGWSGLRCLKIIAGQPPLVPSDFSVIAVSSPRTAWDTTQYLQIDSLGGSSTSDLSYYLIETNVGEVDSVFGLLDEDDMKALYDTVMAVGFFGLDSLYESPLAGGSSLSISVRANGISHRVEIVNYGLEEIIRIAWYLNQILQPLGVEFGHNLPDPPGGKGGE